MLQEPLVRDKMELADTVVVVGIAVVGRLVGTEVVDTEVLCTLGKIVAEKGSRKPQEQEARSVEDRNLAANWVEKKLGSAWQEGNVCCYVL